MPYADLVFSGGRVFTADTVRSTASAVAVKDGRIVAVGHEDVRELIGAHTDIVNLAGRLLVPGFQDAHVHPVWGGLDLLRCNLAEVSSRTEYRTLIAEHMQANPDAEWLLGGGWNMSVFPGGTPLASDLDDIVADRPAFLTNRDGHGAWVNSRALQLAGIDKNTPDPADGRSALVALSAEATDKLAVVEAAITETNAQAFGLLSAAERKQFFDIMGKIVTALGGE